MHALKRCRRTPSLPWIAAAACLRRCDTCQVIMWVSPQHELCSAWWSERVTSMRASSQSCWRSGNARADIHRIRSPSSQFVRAIFGFFDVFCSLLGSKNPKSLSDLVVTDCVGVSCLKRHPGKNPCNVEALFWGFRISMTPPR